ncbi:MAG: TM2 domain-containing protein [Sphaerochaetaceae bacterium]|jgi:hypothetical protein|nr:TM2 domain-containing protein [Sphaerochaetaceae bacterium]MDD4220309.1 TM2 domain-containing protein [Sphaerochaetaceae bacterium]MDY0371814.1 TM2 domain-containing protein [Sphaerochaetaceae bacterium]
MDLKEQGQHGKYCHSCGKSISKQAEICPYCGVRVGAPPSSYFEEHRTWIIVLLLCLFVGPLGIHRFFVGKRGTGILMLLTLGGFGIWVIIDLILIVTGNFTDANGMIIY